MNVRDGWRVEWIDGRAYRELPRRAANRQHDLQGGRVAQCVQHRDPLTGGMLRYTR